MKRILLLLTCLGIVLLSASCGTSFVSRLRLERDLDPFEGVWRTEYQEGNEKRLDVVYREQIYHVTLDIKAMNLEFDDEDETKGYDIELKPAYDILHIVDAFGVEKNNLKRESYFKASISRALNRTEYAIAIDKKRREITLISGAVMTFDEKKETLFFEEKVYHLIERD